jgi:uncharacterized protein (DUF1330 family)
MNLTQVSPSQEQLAELMAYPKNTPLVMLNIIKYKAKTEEGKQTGEELYAEYFQKAASFVAKSGAKLIWKGKVASTVIGDSQNQPDIVFLVEYKSVNDFLAMIANPEYQKIANNRKMALEYGGLIACQTKL